MRLSEIYGEDAIDVIAEILEPAATILADAEVKAVIESRKPYIIVAKTILSRQKKAILEVLAVLNRKDPKEFKPSLIELPIMLIHLLEDIAENQELMSLFQSRNPMMGSVSSGSVTENTKETEGM